VCEWHKRPKTGPQKRCQLCNNLQSAFKPKLAAFDPKWKYGGFEGCIEDLRKCDHFRDIVQTELWSAVKEEYITRREKKGKKA
jgi:hypothetical protein